MDRIKEYVINYVYEVTDEVCSGIGCNQCPFSNKEGKCTVALIEDLIRRYIA